MNAIKSSNRAEKLILQRDRDIFNSIRHSITLREPTPLLGLRGLGKDIIFEYITTHIDELKFDGDAICADITSAEDAEAVLEKADGVKGNLLLVVDFSLESDISQFIKKLDYERTKKDEKFVYIIFINCRHVRQLLKDMDKAIFRNLHIIKPLNREDSCRLLESYNLRFGIDLSKDKLDKIYELSNGHSGLIKTLALEAYSNKINLNDVDSLLNNLAIVSRLELLIHDVLENIGEEYINQNSLLLENLGFVQSKEFFSPLLKIYFERKYLKDRTFEISLSANEQKVFNVLKSNRGKAVSRDEAAKGLWGDELLEKYSDWAIDQLISRLRKKIEPEYRIVAKKGIGFILQ